MEVKELYDLSIIYGILATIITIISFLNHQFALFASIFDTFGALILFMGYIRSFY